MNRATPLQPPIKPLVEIASDETVVRALMQSAHPVEFIESNGATEQVAEPDRT